MASITPSPRTASPRWGDTTLTWPSASCWQQSSKGPVTCSRAHVPQPTVLSCMIMPSNLRCRSDNGGWTSVVTPERCTSCWWLRRRPSTRCPPTRQPPSTLTLSMREATFNTPSPGGGRGGRTKPKYCIGWLICPVIFNLAIHRVALVGPKNICTCSARI